MYQERRWLPELQEQDAETANRQTASLASVAVILFLLVLGLFLVRELHAKMAIEDCLMAARLDCDHLVAALR